MLLLLAVLAVLVVLMVLVAVVLLLPLLLRLVVVVLLLLLLTLRAQYFESPTSKEPKGVVPLLGMVVYERGEGQKKAEISLEIHPREVRSAPPAARCLRLRCAPDAAAVDSVLVLLLLTFRVLAPPRSFSAFRFRFRPLSARFCPFHPLAHCARSRHSRRRTGQSCRR